jgi:cytochrome P450
MVRDPEQAGIDLKERLFTKRLLQDPYPVYRHLQTHAPVHYDRHSGELLLTRYRDVVTALKHPRLSSRRVAETGIPVPNFFLWAMRPVSGLLSRQMLFSDPPDHTRLRRLANRAFAPRVVQALRPSVERIANELLDALGAAPEVDVVRGFAVWLPLLVIAELLGVPTQRRAAFKVWSDDLALFIGGSTKPLPVVLSRGARGVLQLRRFFRHLVRQRRREGAGSDLLGALIAAEEQGDMLTEEELLANAILLLAAGHETTTNLIGNGMLALLRHPDQLAALRAEPALLGSAIDELLRYDSPVQWTGRVALEPIELAGHRIPEGQTVAICLGAANRDPSQFTDPDRLDLRRDNSHLAFGHGIHYCLGSALAKLEGEVAFSALLERYPEMRLSGGPIEWQENFTLRGVKSLRVAVR